MGLLNVWIEWILDNMDSFDEVLIGDGTDEYDEDQTGLQGSESYSITMEDGYPELEGRTLSGLIIVPASDAQFDWEEIIIRDPDADVAFIREVIPFGTKGDVEWELEFDATVEVG